MDDFHTKVSQLLVTQKKSFPAGVHKQDADPPPPPPFLSAFPDPRLGVIEMRHILILQQFYVTLCLTFIPIFGVLSVHLDRIIDALLALKSKKEGKILLFLLSSYLPTFFFSPMPLNSRFADFGEEDTPDSQSQDLAKDIDDDKPGPSQITQLRKVWKEAAIHILSSYEKLFAYEDLYALENELIIRVLPLFTAYLS